MRRSRRSSEFSYLCLKKATWSGWSTEVAEPGKAEGFRICSHDKKILSKSEFSINFKERSYKECVDHPNGESRNLTGTSPG